MGFSCCVVLNCKTFKRHSCFDTFWSVCVFLCPGRWEVSSQRSGMLFPVLVYTAVTVLGQMLSVMVQECRADFRQRSCAGKNGMEICKRRWKVWAGLISALS